MPGNSATLLPVGSFVMVPLTAQDKLATTVHLPLHTWVSGFAVKHFLNSVTYRVCDLVSAEQRQLTRKQFKVVELLFRFVFPSNPNIWFLLFLLCPLVSNAVAFLRQAR